MAQGKVRDEKKQAFWRKAFREQKHSGLSIRAFCRERALPESAFYFWRRELARREEVRSSAATFVPVRVTEDATPADGGIERIPRRSPRGRSKWPAGRCRRSGRSRNRGRFRWRRLR